ncbi:hypothetical protein L211DRAFT_850578 [Terfezia boudieri ATCC MYA-4762]|uniref:Uncharacterized protein n=1 Tax=Terfezia boudieri ATCC MYA-4762 TaxID=1051890 RepID=A0A3N4LI24_9PEZI|nr:hypothetical protein L211DRAFT_850578 [Terfezia boudieri ATCC MYA-4762]
MKLPLNVLYWAPHSTNFNASFSVFPVSSKATRNLANPLRKSQSPCATAIASSRTISFELGTQLLLHSLEQETPQIAPAESPPLKTSGAARQSQRWVSMKQDLKRMGKLSK